MKEKTDKLLTLVMLLIGVLCAVFAFFFALKAETNPGSGLWDIVFFVLVAMIAISIIAALIFMFKSLAEKGNLLKFSIFLQTRYVCSKASIILLLLSSATYSEFSFKSLTNCGNFFRFISPKTTLLTTCHNKPKIVMYFSSKKLSG